MDKSTFLGQLTYVAVLVVNIVPMSGLAWFTWRNQKHDEERERAFAELRQANRRLEVTLVENGALYQWMLTQAREAGVLDERQRMAREIHDTLAQGLTGIITQLQAAEQAAPDSAGWRRHVTAATGLARKSLVEARRSVHALHPEPLRTSRLRDALAEVASHWSGLYGINTEVTTTGTARPLSPAAEATLLRTAQEALANVAKHSGASRVGLTLSYMDDEVALDVRDDGHGFDPARLAVLRSSSAVLAEVRDGKPVTTVLIDESLLNHRPRSRNADQENGRNPDAAGPGTHRDPARDQRPDKARDDVPSGGFGLTAMRERIEKVAGTLQVESEPGVGTAISASVPVAERRSADGHS